MNLIESQRPTVAGAVPTIWNDVMNHLDRNPPGHDISSLRLVSCGGSAVPVSLMKAFEEKFDVEIRQLWGMTETSPIATLAWPPPGLTPEKKQWEVRGTQGRPICGVETASSTTRRGAAERRRGGRGGAGGPRCLDHRLLLPQHRRVQVPVRLAAHRGGRGGAHRRPGLHHVDRPGQRRHQVRW